jgi:putative transcriptional regulator
MIQCNLETLLDTKGWTRYRLSIESGVHNAVLAKYAKNEVQEFNGETLSAICATLECSVGELLEYVPAKPLAATKTRTKKGR